MRISEILKSKGSGVFTMRPSDRAEKAVGVFHERKIGAIVIQEPRGDIAGILTERDVVNAIAEQGMAALERNIEDLMSTARTCKPDDKVREVMSMMTLKRVRHAPVVDGGELVGMISIGDLVKHQLDEAQLEVDTMRDFARTH